MVVMTMRGSILVPSLSELKTLKEEIINLYETVSLGEAIVFLPVAGSVLRLIFHDCGGPPEGNTPGIISKCDACIEDDNFPDHENLHQKAVDPLDDIYLGPNQWNTKMTRADFWAFAATVAILATKEQATDNDILPDIPYFFGREDCSTSPDLDAGITNVKPFPGGTFAWQESFNWLNANFGFDVEETVAILGAHTIGRAHASDSGFTGPWVEEWGTFDNEYYKDILKDDWVQQTASNGLKEWSKDGFFIMLNADIGLFKDIDNHNADGSIACGVDIDFCSDNQVAKSHVEAFANDNQLFLNKFVPAYIKMITAGYDINNMIQRHDSDIENGVTPSPTFSPITKEPTKFPTQEPTPTPTERPTVDPIKSPTESPLPVPSKDPTKSPTKSPTELTNSPTLRPTQAPVNITTTMDGCDFDIDGYLEKCYCSDTMIRLNLGSAHSVGFNEINDYIDNDNYNNDEYNIYDDLIMYLNILMPILTLLYLVYIRYRNKRDRIHKYAHVSFESDTEQSIINQ